MDEARGRVLGVDLGLQRTGLAITDELRLTSRALENLKPRSRAEDVAFLVDLVDENDVRVVVIGHPRLPRSGDEGGMARRARGFADALREGLGERACEVHLVDEVGSSREAAERLVESGVKKKNRKASIDGEAARVIIERWLSE
jgi:putative Holliday junction resolvase